MILTAKMQLQDCAKNDKEYLINSVCRRVYFCLIYWLLFFKESNSFIHHLIKYKTPFLMSQTAAFSYMK